MYAPEPSDSFFERSEKMAKKESKKEEKLQCEKISEEEVAKLDRREMGVAITQEADVEGQDHHHRRVECPWCGRHVLLRGEHHWQVCGQCGRPFRVRRYGW